MNLTFGQEREHLGKRGKGKMPKEQFWACVLWSSLLISHAVSNTLCFSHCLGLGFSTNELNIINLLGRSSHNAQYTKNPHLEAVGYGIKQHFI